MIQYSNYYNDEIVYLLNVQVKTKISELYSWSCTENHSISWTK